MAAYPSALIVADSPQLRDSLLILLRAVPGIEAIYQANDVSSALSTSPELEPTLVLLDYDLAKNGVATTWGQIMAQRPQTRFVALVDSEQQMQQAERAGADVVLMKGVLAARLLETIEGLLEGKVDLKGEVQ